MEVVCNANGFGAAKTGFGCGRKLDFLAVGVSVYAISMLVTERTMRVISSEHGSSVYWQGQQACKQEKD